MVAKMTYAHLLIPLAAFYPWPLHQLNVNVFLHRPLEEKVYT